MAGFCIDETSFQRLVDLPSVISRLNDQLSTIHNQHQQQVFKSSEPDYVEVVAELELWKLLYDSSLGLISHDDRLLLIQTIDKCVVWDTDFEMPTEEVAFNNQPCDSFSIVFVSAQALNGAAIGIISSVPGICNVSIGRASTNVFQVSLDERLERFYRFQTCFEEISRDNFAKWVHLSFPRFRFALELSSQLRRFRQNYDNIRDIVVEHLSAVNDEFSDLLIEGAQLSEACDRVKSSWGVVISPESPNTHRNASAMREREVEYMGERIVCEFHTKLTPTHDRIHFSPTVRIEADGRKYIVVGPFAEHLTV